MRNRIDVRPLTRGDIDEVIRIQHLVYPPEKFEPVSRWYPENLEQHLAIFPEGQLVVTLDGVIAGHAVTQRARAEEALTAHTWGQLTGWGSLETHDPEGDVLYGVDVCVSPEIRGRGLGKALYDARVELARRTGAVTIAAGARVPGYGALADRLPADTYVAEVVQGRRNDPTLSFQISQGFAPVRLLRDYFPDPESADWAVLIARPVHARRPVHEPLGAPFTSPPALTGPIDARAG